MVKENVYGVLRYAPCDALRPVEIVTVNFADGFNVSAGVMVMVDELVENVTPTRIPAESTSAHEAATVEGSMSALHVT